MAKRKIVAGILAHVDAGKTTLSESLLYATGVIKKPGRVDTKDAFLDTDNVEKERGITIYLKNARLPLKDKEIILIDTPGHVDFSAEMERALSVLDIAILLISGTAGVQSHTKTLWTLLRNYHIPTVIFVNKMDMVGTERKKVFKEIRQKLSDAAIDFERENESDLFEDIATMGEDYLEEFLSNGNLSDTSINKGIMNREFFPVFWGSALKNMGIEEFLTKIERYVFCPLSTDYCKDNQGKEELSAFVYKISRDKDGKRLSFIKILKGVLRVKDYLCEEKVNEIRVYSGERYETVREVSKGEICALPGLVNTKNGQYIGTEGNHQKPYLSPVLSYAVHFPKDMDQNKVLGYLRELEEEDPSLNVEYREQTKEIFVSLMGEVQTEVLKRKIMDRYSLAVDFSDGKVCYKETVKRSVEGVGHFEPLRHYAEVHIKIEPLERESGIEVDTDVSEDLLERNWQRLIVTHMLEKEHKGVLLGSPLTDVKMTLVSGKAHNKHTEGGDFRQATYRAIRQGLMELSLVDGLSLLEPYYDYTLEIPEEYVGRAMTDISAMSGSCLIAENDYEEHVTILTGRAPVSTMNGYVKELYAYSKGLGRLSLAPSGYDICHNEDEVLSNRSYNPENDLRNPADSVFCSHGAGDVIHWSRVPEYMHLPYRGRNGAFDVNDEMTEELLTRRESELIREAVEANRLRKNRSDDAFISCEEIDKILHDSSHSNENGRQSSFKGISKAQRQRRREVIRENTEVKYIGSPKKEKYILVDGYNLIHAWPRLCDMAEKTMPGAVGSLNDILCNYQAIKGVNLMVVYDAYKVSGHPLEEKAYNNITVVYTKEAQTADQYIERYAHQNSKKYDITVITSDGLEQVIVSGNGCSLISSREFVDLYERTAREFNEKYNVSE